MHDLQFKRLVLVVYGLYLLIRQEIQIWYSELSEPGWELMGALVWQRDGALAGGLPRQQGVCGVWLPRASQQPQFSTAAQPRVALSKPGMQFLSGADK